MVATAPAESICHQPPSVPPATTTCEQHTMSAESSADLDGCIDDWLGATDLQVWFISHQIPSAEVIRQLNSWVIVLMKDMEHILHCAPLEFYLVDNLLQAQTFVQECDALVEPSTWFLFTCQLSTKHGLLLGSSVHCQTRWQFVLKPFWTTVGGSSQAAFICTELWQDQC
jgi:hypothetical protein